ncbi:MAG: hypothetical protein P8R42_21610 [Candidatus Binatia bacterium]|nr:hypothetical protein [Candidatus Binatia bacterium]
MTRPTTKWSALETARTELLPRIDSLQRLSEFLDGHERARFFREIADLIRSANETDERMEPFMRLSTNAFQGFTVSPPEAIVLDEVLETASNVSEVLARDDAAIH